MNNDISPLTIDLGAVEREMAKVRCRVAHLYILLALVVALKVLELAHFGVFKSKRRKKKPLELGAMGEIPLTFNESDQGPCVYGKWPAGFGNVMFDVLHSFISFARDERFSPHHNEKSYCTPCVMGYGNMLSGIFTNFPACPSYYKHDKCLYVTKNRVTMEGLRVYTRRHLENYPHILKLNATFIDDIFTQAKVPFRVKDLQRSSCAVHIRFGDQHSRKYEQMNERNRLITAQHKGRACKEDTRDQCFPGMVQQVRAACPDPNVPTYLAADVPEFLHYFCQEEKKNETGRTMLSSCKAPSPDRINHINDVPVPLINASNGYSINAEAFPTFLNVYTDWLALALAQKMTGIGLSTFSQTANFSYYTG